MRITHFDAPAAPSDDYQNYFKDRLNQMIHSSRETWIIRKTEDISFVITKHSENFKFEKITRTCVVPVRHAIGFISGLSEPAVFSYEVETLSPQEEKEIRSDLQKELANKRVTSTI
jgi:hypothetical protein